MAVNGGAVILVHSKLMGQHREICRTKFFATSKSKRHYLKVLVLRAEIMPIALLTGLLSTVTRPIEIQPSTQLAISIMKNFTDGVRLVEKTKCLLEHNVKIILHSDVEKLYIPSNYEDILKKCISFKHIRDNIV